MVGGFGQVIFYLYNICQLVDGAIALHSIILDRASSLTKKPGYIVSGGLTAINKVRFVVWTLVRSMLRTKVHTTNGFCF
ncbi:MAG: hypothetical protein EAZ60_16615 [Oscillatoriales cyanobacterium]|nr:MAG: hypothetical protein EAZ83_27915 [Oscillatoriales cyanobacterium]TAE94853.1 MAG: hypothetical protein EAZ79_21405 [Oscillatoriales cyanobacterium]TAF14774.1 MAG: hypothetical protein EAZ73_28270 [Oscillatoriales cyanobacterium]TAF28785.1 MAG: hypothetical protein EAZ69_26010 [Oscillatoriales cyanobacterium]TAF54469.1 MAG: hypothetical protein EAZ60_16615 [Oscillatoriales cyanobacterium]